MGCCCVCVKESEVGIIESWGSFSQIAYPGGTCINCCSESMVGTISLRQEQHKLTVETRSRDNVFITLSLAIQTKIAASHTEFEVYRAKYGKQADDEITLEQTTRARHAPVTLTAKEDKGLLYNAFYRLDSPITQILSYVEEYFRFHGMQYSLDEMFAAKNDMTHELIELLNIKMNPYGYIICNILVLDIDPDIKVKRAMNDIIACEKEKRAQQSRAEAEKITKILAAEAESRTRELAGEGIANARKAILNGLQTSVETFQQALPGSDPNQILKTVLMTQYLDTIKEAAQTGRNTFIMPSSPAQILTVEEQLRAAIGAPQPPKQMQLF